MKLFSCISKTPSLISHATFVGLIISLLSVGQIQSQDAELTKQVLALFEERCQECHHPDTDDEEPYLHEKVTIAELFIESDLLDKAPLVAGKPDESGVFHRVNLEDTSRRRMPKSKGAPGDKNYREPLAAAEKKLIKDWILSIKADAAPAKKITKTTPKPLPEPSKEAVKAGSINQEAIPADASLTDQVRFVFESKCADCHYPDNDYPDLSQTANLAILLKPSASGEVVAKAILDRTARDTGAKGRMPKTKGKDGDSSFRHPLSIEEKSVIERWVKSGESTSAKREIITSAEVIRKIYDDVSAHESEAKYFRYLTLTNLYNSVDEDGSPQIDDDTMESHRAGIGKLINSLSLHGRITFPDAIDEEKTIYRIDLRDYKWSDTDWERIANYYPHGIVGIDRQKENLIARETGSRMAYLRADWFAFAAAQPPLYDDILGYLLGTYQTDKEADIVTPLEKRLGIDRAHNLQNGKAIRAGFHRSGVSEANRLIERHEIESYRGAYWISYDFKRRAANSRDSLFRAPLGPQEAHLSGNLDHVFDHDGGEIIFNLPNGLQAYILATAKGKRLDTAPIEIVQDNSHPENVILNGISCMRCHDQGMNAALRVPFDEEKWDEKKDGPRPNTLAGMRDEVRDAVLDAGILDFKEKAILESIYVSPEELQRAVLHDTGVFTEASNKATGGFGGATEPIYGLFQEYIRMVDARRLSSELGMSREEVLRLLEKDKRKTESLAILYNWLEKGNAERREALLQDYLTLVYALGFELMPFEPLGYEEFGGQEFADLIRKSDAFTHAFGSGSELNLLDAVSGKKALVTSSAARVRLTKDRVLIPGGGVLEISIQPKLVVGDKAELVIKTTEDVHVRAVHLSSDQFVTELYPGTTGKTTLLKKGKERIITWTTTDPGGPEHVIVYASRGAINNNTRGARNVTSGFQVFTRKEFFSSRGIPKGIKSNDAGSTSSTQPVSQQIIEAKVGYFLQD